MVVSYIGQALNKKSDPPQREDIIVFMESTNRYQVWIDGKQGVEQKIYTKQELLDTWEPVR